MGTSIQALWFRADEWTQENALAWAADHDFAADTVRTRVDDAGHVTHYILPQFDPPQDAQWITLSDTFPSGVSASAIVTEDKTTMERIVKAGQQSADDPFEFVLSDESVDRDGDIIRADGWNLTNFKKNPVALFGHAHSQPIGVWENVRVEGKKLLGRLKMAAAGTSAEIDTIRSLLEQRILRAVSVGFAPIDYEIMKDQSGIEFTKTELLETSVVSVPANPAALAMAKSFGANPDNLFTPAASSKGSNMRARFMETATRKTPAPLGSAPTTPNPSAKKDRKMNIAERIAAKNTRFVAVKDRLTEIKGLLEADAEYELTDDEQAELEALTDEQETLTKSIEALQKIENGLAAKAVPANSAPKPAGGTVPARAAEKEKGGSLLVKTISAHLVAHMTQSPLSEVLDQMYGDDERVKSVSKIYGNRRAVLSKAAVDAADTTSAGWAAELVRTDYAAFLQDLAAVSVYGALVANGATQSLTFGGANTITIPRRNRAAQSTGAAAGLAAAAGLGSQTGGSWVGEGGVIPVKAMALGSQTMSRYKLAVISAMTNEILEQSVPNIENLVRAAILEDTSMAVDGALLDGAAAVAGVRPASVFDGAATQASAGATGAQIITDLKYLLGQLSAINGAAPVLIMNSNRLLGLSTITTAAGGFLFRDEIAAGRLLGIPVISSTNVNPAAVGILDAGSFVGANDAPMFAISDQAALTMADAGPAAPSQAGDATDHTGGDLGTAEQVPADGGIVLTGDTTAAPAGTSVTGYMAQSLFQQNQSAVRMILPASWGMVRPGAAAWLSAVAW